MITGTRKPPSELVRQIEDAVAFLRARTTMAPRAGVVLGTGLGSLADAIAIETSVPYEDIPHFPVAGVESHAGDLVFGRIGPEPVVVMRGRVHYYEGYTMKQVTFPLRVLRALGADTVILTSATGGLNPLYRLGEVVAVVDHVNLMGDNPLIGPNDESLGPRFPDMSEPYDRGLVALVERIALEEGLPLQKGVLVGVAGPNLETAAEYRFLRQLGADVVGMSTIPETLVGVHGGMRVLALSVVTDLCLPDRLEPVVIERILEVATRSTPAVDRLIRAVITRLDQAPRSLSSL